MRSDAQKIEESINSVVSNVEVNVEKMMGELVQRSARRTQQPGVIQREKRKRNIIAVSLALRSRRGRRVYEIFAKNPVLSEQSQSRRKVHNRQRNQIWQQITTEINKEFSGQLDHISVSGTKKLADYWKGRFRNNESPPNASIGRDTVSPSPPKIFPTPPSTPPKEMAEVKGKEHEKWFEEKKAERLHFLIEATKQYLKVTGLEKAAKCRSTIINKRRHLMWQLITEKLNNKYGAHLGELLLDQVKKSFSNYKRRHPDVLS